MDLNYTHLQRNAFDYWARENRENFFWAQQWTGGQEAMTQDTISE